MDARETVYFVIGLIIGVIFHEYMHGKVADLLGDHTARNSGRLTLNPIPHIDPFGSILLPLVLIVTRSPFLFAYAKPVPVNPFFLRKPKRDMVLVALAGPLTNLTVAIVFTILGFLARVAGITNINLLEFFLYAAAINLVLMLFNLIPIPPLDGSHILEYFLPRGIKEPYAMIGPYGFIIIILILYLAGNVIFRILNPLFHLISTLITNGRIVF